MIKKVIPLVLLLLIIVGGSVWLNQRRIHQDDEAAVRFVVENFGKSLKNVSLLSPTAPQDIENNYKEYVASDLLSKWVDDPSQALGRLTSSPWPDRIEISSIKQFGSGAYDVSGNIVEVTSQERTDTKRPIDLGVVKYGSRWYISGVNLGEYTSDDKLKEKIGQMIMAGFRGLDFNSDAYTMIKNAKVGGFTLFDYDVPSKSYPRNIVDSQQTKNLISSLQANSSIPLFISVDAEGGNVNRLNKIIKINSAQDMAKNNTTSLESAKLASKLRELGFNMNFAPVVDVNENPGNPIIGALGRSFSSDPNVVISNAKIFIDSHNKENIITIAKHFPGHGSSTKDSHLGVVDVTNTYKEEELLPYKELNLKAVMVAHIFNNNIDDKYPASLSSIFLQDILRKQIGFKGIIIADDMQMGAISSNYSLNDAIISAINAGVDIITVLNNSPNGYDKDLALKAVDIIFNAVKEGKITEQRINESYNRIIDIKKEFGIIKTYE